MKLRVIAMTLLTALLVAACAAPAPSGTTNPLLGSSSSTIPSGSSTVPTNSSTSTTTSQGGEEETVDYFRALYPVDGQIPDKKGISDIVKEMGKGLGKITEIDYTFKNGKVTMNVQAGNTDKYWDMTRPEESPLQLIYDQNEYYNYVLYLPEGYDPEDTETKWPVIFFFHGIGEKGNDLEKLLPYGPLRYLNRGGKLDAIVIAPQCPAESHWADDNKEERKLVQFVPQMAEQYNIDTSRMYLTGLSMGGRCTWKLALAMPDTFAAIAVICGRTNTYEFENFKDMPIWMFHGAQDSTVDFSNINKILKRLKEKGHSYYKVTIYPHGSHEIWDTVYDNPEVYDWLLNQSRTVTE